MKKELSQIEYDRQWARLSFRMSRTSFLLSIERLFVAELVYASTALGMTLCRLRSWLVFQWEFSLWRPTGNKSGKTSSE